MIQPPLLGVRKRLCPHHPAGAAASRLLEKTPHDFRLFVNSLPPILSAGGRPISPGAINARRAVRGEAALSWSEVFPLAN